MSFVNFEQKLPSLNFLYNLDLWDRMKGCIAKKNGVLFDKPHKT